MVKVVVTAREKDWVVAFSQYDAELIPAFKSIIPGGKRRWDPNNHEWRVSTDIAELCIELERLGAKITRVGERDRAGSEHPRVERPDDTDSAVDWKHKHEALNNAARHMQAEMLRLQEEVQQLQKEAQQLEEEGRQLRKQLADVGDPTPASGSWAEQLFSVVGRQRREKVHKALTNFLHPDRPGGNPVLMQQLNDARAKFR